MQMRVFKIGFFTLFTVAFLTLAVALIGQNTDTLTVTLFNYATVPYPKWAVLLSCILFGALLSTLFFIVELIVLETKNIRLRRANQRMERLLAKMEKGTLPEQGPTPPLSATSRDAAWNDLEDPSDV